MSYKFCYAPFGEFNGALDVANSNSGTWDIFFIRYLSNIGNKQIFLKKKKNFIFLWNHFIAIEESFQHLHWQINKGFF